MAGDPFADLLGIEDQFYDEGYELGVKDGGRTGFIEGRLFGLEKGFEKYLSSGKLHGRATVWAGRLPIKSQEPQGRSVTTSKPPIEHDEESNSLSKGAFPDISVSLPQLRSAGRLEKHIRTLYALTEPTSLSTMNDEAAVSDLEDRLKRADGKVKILERATGDMKHPPTNEAALPKDQAQDGDGGIEDSSSTRVRH